MDKFLSYLLSFVILYVWKMVIPLPAPVGLVCLEKINPSLTLFCFVSMANGINITNGFDGLAAGAAALAFVGMSIVVLPICADLAIFEASVAGVCVVFLMHNRYKASIFMGDTRALALGGALAAMASCTGMFVLEAVSVIAQVSFFKVIKFFGRTGRRLFNMTPFHRHLELSGVEEPTIVAAAYVIACALILCAAYVILSDGDLPALANMKVNLELNHLSTNSYTIDDRVVHNMARQNIL